MGTTCHSDQSIRFGTSRHDAFVPNLNAVHNHCIIHHNFNHLFYDDVVEVIMVCTADARETRQGQRATSLTEFEHKEMLIIESFLLTG